MLTARVFSDGEWLKRWSSRPLAHAVLLTAPVLAMMLLFVVTGFRGIDFGEHWDEVEWHVQPAQKMVSSGVFLPHTYVYPSFSRWLVLLPSVPAAAKAGLHGGGDPRRMQAAMAASTTAPDYLLRVRRVFVVVSALGILWIYLATLALRRPWWEALLAAGTLGLSWEFAYHARWLATDCIVVQFTALTLLFLAVFYRTRRLGWLYLAAVAAGLGTGTKYPGVVLLVPVLLTSAVAFPVHSWRQQIVRMGILCFVAFSAYAIVTPGMLLDPFKFIEDLRLMSRIYSTGHDGYSVSGPWHHVRLVLAYLALDYFSPVRWLAVPLFGSLLVGAVFWWRADRRVAAVLLSFPIVFLIFFCSRYRVMIVRNYLLIIPFLAPLLARAFGEVWSRLRVRWARPVLAAALIGIGLLQAGWLVRAAESLHTVDDGVAAQQAVSYVAGHPGVRFRLSEKVRALALAGGRNVPANVVAGPDADVVVFFARTEGPRPRQWKTNDPWLTRAVFGPREINFNWYSTWAGRDRVVAMTREKAASFGVALAR